MHISDAKPINVFLVDDHKTVLWGLEQLVRSAAPRMAVAGTAASCAEMFAALAGTEPDVILLDLDLGGESGLDCLEKLSRQSAARVLVLTGSSDPEVHQRAVFRGARGVVHKQQAADVLLRAIEKVSDGEIWLDRTNLGRVMSALASGKSAHPEAAKIAELTPKERQIVAAVVKEKGARGKVIADKLHMSEHTLRNHLTTIYSKLEVAGRMELYIYATSQRQLDATA
jgi:DNA-binding NarL/FixJ family response regulator